MAQPKTGRRKGCEALSLCSLFSAPHVLNPDLGVAVLVVVAMMMVVPTCGKSGTGANHQQDRGNY